MLPLFLAAIAGLQSGSRKSQVFGIVALIAEIGAKESAGPIAAGMGLAWVLGAAPEPSRGRMKRWGWWIGALGTAAFLIDVLIVPKLFSSTYVYASSYSEATQGGPGIWLGKLFGPARLRFLLFLALPFGLLPFLRPTPALWAVIPALGMFFLSNGTARVSGYHYAIEPLVGIAWGSCAALQNLRFKWTPSIRSLLLFLLFGALFSHGRSYAFYARYYQPSPRAFWMRETVLPAIAERASLSSTSNWVPHVSARERIHIFPELDNAAESTPSDCILIDAQGDSWPAGPKKVRSERDRLVSLGKYRSVWACKSIEILQRGDAALSCLTRRIECE